MSYSSKSDKQLAALFVELGKIDKKRRELLSEIHSHPTYLVKYIEDSLKKLEKMPWMRRPSISPFVIEDLRKLQSFEIIREDKTERKVTVKLNFVDPTGKKYPKQVEISTAREVEPQLLQNLKQLTPAEERKVKKELASLEATLQKEIKKQEIKKQITELQKQLDSL